jgi:hypothetical protein
LHLNLYVPRLQIEQGVVGRFREHRGQPLPSAALMTPMSRNFVAKPERLTAEHEIPIEQFRNGRRKRRSICTSSAGKEDAGVPRRKNDLECVAVQL